MAGQASESDCSSTNDIPSLDGVTERTAKEPASLRLQRPLPETGDSATSANDCSSALGNTDKMMQQMKLTDEKSIFEPVSNCERSTLKITSIDPRKFQRICNLLNIPRVLGGDWRTLAGKLGYTVLETKIFEHKYDPNGPTGCLLYDWDSGKDHFAGEIVKFLKEMDRDDVVKVLEEEINKKCSQCNCANCGGLL